MEQHPAAVVCYYLLVGLYDTFRIPEYHGVTIVVPFL